MEIKNTFSPRVRPKVLVGDSGLYESGVILDSNASVEIVTKIIENHDKEDKYIGKNVFVEDGDLYQIKDNNVYPISHPDLSTQPSILPQRFGNLDMYEVLSRVEDISYNYLGELEYEADSNTHLNIGLGDSGIQIELINDIETLENVYDLHDGVWILTVNDGKLYGNTLVASAGTSGALDINIVKIIVDSNGKYVFYTGFYNYKPDDFTLDISILGGGSIFTVMGDCTLTLGNVIRFKGHGNITVQTDVYADIDLNSLSYKFLKDLESSARPILASAFNDTNCESVKIGKEDNGDWSIKSELDFTPDYVLCQYYKGDGGYYYYESKDDGGETSIPTPIPTDTSWTYAQDESVVNNSNTIPSSGDISDEFDTGSFA